MSVLNSRTDPLLRHTATTQTQLSTIRTSGVQRQYSTRCSASSEQARPSPLNRPSPPPRTGARTPAPPVPLGPDGQPLQVVAVEKTGQDAWAGVAQIDKGEQGLELSSLLTLVAGDLAAFLAFAAIGRLNHGETLNLEVLWTALPFIAGWALTAPLLGGFGRPARYRGPAEAALLAAKCTAVAVPLGVAFRSAARGYVPAPAFVVVSLVTNLVLLVAWRAAIAAATPQDVDDSSIAAQLAARKDKKGNPFEFLTLLSSLTNRW